MTTQTFTLLANGTRTDTTIQSGAFDWPANITAVNIKVVSATFTNPATSLDLSIEQSTDGGTTWRVLAGNGAEVGGQLDRHGNPKVVQLGIQFDPVTAAQARKVRGKCVVVGSITFSLTIDVTT